MSLILSGTDGLSDVDGSAATPAIRGTDANTGIFFPAADTIAFSEGGVEAMRIDSAGNLGLGVTPSAWSGFSSVLQQRGGGQCPAGGFHHLAQADMAEAGAAVVLRHHEAGPAKLGHFAPERAGETIGVPAVAQFAQGQDGGFLAEPVMCGFAHHLGVGGEDHGHGREAPREGEKKEVFFL